jgi:hypothetical protein
MSKHLSSGEEKRGGYSGGTPAKNVKPPAKLPSGTLKAPKVKQPTPKSGK